MFEIVSKLQISKALSELARCFNAARTEEWPISEKNQFSGKIGFLIQIENINEMTAAYGEEIVRSVSDIAYDRASSIIDGSCGWISRASANIFVILMENEYIESAQNGSNHGLSAQRILATIQNDPIYVNDLALLLNISLSVLHSSMMQHLLEGDDGFAYQGFDADASSRGKYQTDMARAAAVFLALNNSDAVGVRQPICDAYPGGKVLYYEYLSRFGKISGDVNNVGDLFGSLERLKLASRFDQRVALNVIGHLKSNSQLQLGCNLSAQSAALDLNWEPIVSILEKYPELASRLVFEITETSPLPCDNLVLDFVSAMRGLGCRFALDDFGKDFSGLHSVEVIKPEIIKIDASTLHAARGDALGQRRLFHLVGYAASVTDNVVVEGVESLTDLDLAAATGANWFQGYLTGMPIRLDSVPSARHFCNIR